MLREVGSLQTIPGKPRRHVLTFADTWAPGEPRAVSLPASIGVGQWHAFRLHIGPRPVDVRAVVRLGVEAGPAVERDTMEVCVNGELCDYAGPLELPKPRPDSPAYGYSACGGHRPRPLRDRGTAIQATDARLG